MADEQVTFTTRLGKLTFSTSMVENILDRRIVRIVGNELSVARSGLRDRPFLCLNKAQDVHHCFRSPQQAFRALTYSRDWEGESDDPPPDSERDRLKHWLEAHPQLALWVSQEFMTDQERRRYERACTKLATDMGRPIDEVKARILELTFSAATAEQRDTAIELLAEATSLDRERLVTVTRIGNGLRWRSLVILREIVSQQELMTQAHEALIKLHHEHCRLGRTMVGREQHFADVLALKEELGKIKDRPYRGLARRDRLDLQKYHDQAGLGLITDGFVAGGLNLRRPIMAHRLFNFARRLDIILFRLTLAQGRRGHKREGQLSKGHIELMAIKQELDQLSPPGARTELENDPYWRVLGLVYEAHLAWTHSTRDLEHIRTPLRAAIAALG